MTTYRYINGELITPEAYKQQQRQQQALARYEAPVGEILPPQPTLPAAVHQQTHEHSTPMERSRSFTVRYANIAAILLLLSVGLVWVVSGALIISTTLALFGILAVIAFIVLTRQDFEHSAYGNERLRIQQMAKMLDRQSARQHREQMKKMRYAHELNLKEMEVRK